MKLNSKTILLWIAAFGFMLVFVVYQRLTGPTHPALGHVELAGETVKYRLLRSWGKHSDAEIIIKVPNGNISGTFHFRRFKSFDKWTETQMQKSGEYLIAFIPHQPPAGKVMYNIRLHSGKESALLRPEPVILRYTGVVPPYILWPHIILMFLAMVFAIRALIEAFLMRSNIFNLTFLTFIMFLIGGLILGPIVQKYAFDAYWTGWPLGHDLTDNKVLVSFILWAVALFKTWKNPKHRAWVIIAGLGLIAVYLIPHSVLGSEIDFTKMKK
ncbi:MAG: hypothetical protein WCR42_02150 [bacterium]